MSNEQDIEQFQNPTFAVLDGNVVINIVVVRDVETATRLFGKVIQYDHTVQVGIGCTYDEETGRFVE